MAYTGRLRWKGVPLLGQGSLSLQSLKGNKMARRRILWLWKSRGNVRVFFIYSYLRLEAMENVLFDWLLSGSIPHLRNSKENGYRLWVQWFLESLRWKNVSYDWSMVFIATSNQSKGTLVHPNDSRNRCAESFTLQFLEWELMAPRDRFFVSKPLNYVR